MHCILNYVAKDQFCEKLTGRKIKFINLDSGDSIFIIKKNIV